MHTTIAYSAAPPTRMTPRRSHTYHHEDNHQSNARSLSLNSPEAEGSSGSFLSPSRTSSTRARVPDAIRVDEPGPSRRHAGPSGGRHLGSSGARDGVKGRASSMYLDDGPVGRRGHDQGRANMAGTPHHHTSHTSRDQLVGAYATSPSPSHSHSHIHSHSPSPATSPPHRSAHSVPPTPVAPSPSFQSSPNGQPRLTNDVGGTEARQGRSGPAVLIPTDRPIDELLYRWMGSGRRKRFRVDCEVRLVGYGLWTTRDWYLSRDRFSLSILTLTHKPSDIVSMYRLVPAAYFGDTPGAPSPNDLSALDGGINLEEAEQEVAALLKELMRDIKGQVRKTDWGSLIISTPRGTGQDSFAVPAGDMRVARPLLMLTTGLRRLGCSGRAALPLWLPEYVYQVLEQWRILSTAQRKFYETYRVPQAPNTPSTPSSTGNTSSSATSATPISGASPAAVARRQTILAPTSPSGAQTQAADTNNDRSPNGPAAQPHKDQAGPASSSSSPSGWVEPLNANSLPAITDPFHLMILEIVKLIQASLAMWGLFPYADGTGIDGMFCNDTKQAMEDWRAAVSWQEDDAVRKDREGRGGCIEPRTLAGLLSSVTSTYYQLGNMDVDGKLPKDPFTKVDKFLSVWHVFQEEFRHTGPTRQPHRFLSVPLLRSLANDFAAARARSAADPLKVPRLIKATVANAAHAIKLSLPDDGPLRKREYLRDHEDTEEGTIYGRRASAAHDVSDLIMPGGSGGPAAPNMLSANLESYIQSILRTSHKDQPELGARRIWVLWSGSVDELVKMAELAQTKAATAVAARHSQGAAGDGWLPPSHTETHGYTNGYTHGRKNSRGTDTEAEGAGGHGGTGVRAVAAEAMRRTGTVLKGGVGRLVPVARRGHTVSMETSDSEAAASRYVRKKTSLPVPTVIEPTDGSSPAHLHARDREYRSVSPSPSTTLLNHPRPSTVRSGTYLGATSAPGSNRPSIVTSLTNGSDRSFLWQAESGQEQHGGPGGGGSDRADNLLAAHPRSRQRSPMYNASEGSDAVHRPHYDHLNLNLHDLPRPSVSADSHSAPIRMNGTGARRLYRTRNGSVYEEPPRGQRRLSTASDGADVLAEVGDNEWRIISPHGRGRGHQEDILVHAMQRAAERKRRHSWHVLTLDHDDDRGDEDAEDRETEWDHLRIDIELAYTTFLLRKRQKELAQRAQQLQKLETTIFKASDSLIATMRARRAELDGIKVDAGHIIDLFERAPHDMVDGSQTLQELESRIRYRTTEDGGDSTRLAESARNMRTEYVVAKKAWMERMAALAGGDHEPDHEGDGRSVSPVSPVSDAPGSE